MGPRGNATWCGQSPGGLGYSSPPALQQITVETPVPGGLLLLWSLTLGLLLLSGQQRRDFCLQPCTHVLPKRSAAVLSSSDRWSPIPFCVFINPLMLGDAPCTNRAARTRQVPLVIVWTPKLRTKKGPSRGTLKRPVCHQHV